MRKEERRKGEQRAADTHSVRALFLFLTTYTRAHEHTHTRSHTSILPFFPFPPTIGDPFSLICLFRLMSFMLQLRIILNISES